MAIDYSKFLSDEQKQSILQHRLTQFATEAFQHEINKNVAKVAENDEALKLAEESLKTLEIAIQVHQKELDALG